MLSLKKDLFGAHKYSNIFTFIDNLCMINDSSEFHHYFKHVYSVLYLLWSWNIVWKTSPASRFHFFIWSLWLIKIILIKVFMIRDMNLFFNCDRSCCRRCSVRKRVFRNFAKLQNSQENTCELWKISKNTFFTEHVWATASFVGMLYKLRSSYNIYLSTDAEILRIIRTFSKKWNPLILSNSSQKSCKIRKLLE